MADTEIVCRKIGEEKIDCNGTLFEIPEKILNYTDEAFWVYLGIYVGLVLVAGLMSGLTMGLLSLDLMTLKIMKDGGTETEKRQAKKILPIVERHHLLLVTLLLANAGAVEAMPIFLDKISSPVIAICVSVTAVLIFGEVVPQAICTRYGLAIGAALTPFVYVLIGIFFIISWPLSKLLDCVLGKDHSTFYRRAELKVLVNLHGPSSNNLKHQDEPDENGDALTLDEVLIIQGALDMKNKTVKDAMLPLDNVFMLSTEDCMSHETMKKVLEHSHSRVPVYEGTKSNIIGILLVKTLIMLDPDDKVPVKTLLTSESTRELVYVNDDMPLFDLLNLFQTGKSHLAFVRKHSKVTITCETNEPGDSDVECLLVNTDETDQVDGPEGKIVGIITLEDVIEELIQEEIIDETDVYVDIQKRVQVARARRARMDKIITRQFSNISREGSGYTEMAQPHDLEMLGNRTHLSPNRRLSPRRTSRTLPDDSINTTQGTEYSDDTQPLLS